MSTICSADHQACRYGSAYRHAMIRALWTWQLETWQREAARQGEGG